MDSEKYIVLDNVTYKVLERKGEQCDLEGTVKNKWRWCWLEERDLGPHKDFLSDYIVKINKPGYAYCTYCKTPISYGSAGKNNLRKHAQTKEKHKKEREVRVSNTSLPVSYYEPVTNTDQQPTCQLPYGAADNVHDKELCDSGKVVVKKPLVSLLDRKCNIEAYIVSFICEHNLPLSVAPHLTQLCKDLSVDSKALNAVNISATSATYKIVDGLGVHKRRQIISNLRKSPFSINIDECTASSGMKVFTILVSYFDESIGECVVEHYCSFECIKTNAVELFEGICDVFAKDQIPFDNLISDLSDSAAYMRGVKSGIEKRLRDKALHLLDIDGDLCHKVHNAVKVFCKPFKQHIESLWRDIHNDVKFSADIKQALQHICLIIGSEYHKPSEPVAHRWLSSYNSTTQNYPMFSALWLLYFSWMTKEDRLLYKDEKELLTVDASKEGKQNIIEIQSTMRKKGLTKKGKERKQRIFGKLIHRCDMTKLVAEFYQAVLPLFKSFVLIFQQKSPQVHRLHSSISSVTREFFACFMEHSTIKGLTGSKLQKVDVKGNLRKSKHIYTGTMTRTLGKKLKEEKKIETLNEFKACVKEAYVETAMYIQKNFPLSNRVLQCLAGLDPNHIVSGKSYIHLKTLSDFFPTILGSEEDRELYLNEVSRIQLDDGLPSTTNEAGKDIRLDHWWNKVFLTKKYPVLSKVVKACLSIFTGPQVESSFSKMNDIIDRKSNRMNVETYDGIMTVKYSLQSKSSSEIYHRKDPLYDPINSNAVYFVRTANARYKTRIAKKRKEKSDSNKALGAKKIPVERKKQSVHKVVETIREEICEKVKKSMRSKTKKSSTVTAESVSNPKETELEVCQQKQKINPGNKSSPQKQQKQTLVSSYFKSF
eukprot:TCONS_00040959-protein